MSQANAEVELIRAINAVRGRDWAAAADLTTSLRREFPSHELGYEVGANAARMLRRFDEAARIRDEAARRFGASFWLALEQTLAAQAVEDWAGVYEAAARLRAQFPDQRAGYQLGITAARELRRLADATAVARAALEKFQGEAWVVLAQLTIALVEGDPAETLRLAAALRASDPAEPRGYSLAIGTLRGLERFEEALALLREAEPRFAAEPWFKTRSAEIAALRGDRVRTAPLLAALAALPKAPPAPDRPKVAVILGMHRAGTSLAAKIVARLGYGLGGPLLKPGPDNPDGYQEHQEINARHEELLAQLGMTWDCSWLARPAGEDADHAGPIRERLAAIVREQLEACGGRWAFKDPRTAAFLPLWMDLFDALAVEPIYILAVRAPQDTAASLAKRNGMSAPTAELLWTEHYLTALRRLGPRIACVVHYEDWFAAPERQLRSLSDVLDAPDAIDRAHEVILAGLRHHADAQRPCALPIAEEVAAWLYADAPDFATLQVEAQRLWDRLRGLARA